MTRTWNILLCISSEPYSDHQIFEIIKLLHINENSSYCDIISFKIHAFFNFYLWFVYILVIVIEGVMKITKRNTLSPNV